MQDETKPAAAPAPGPPDPLWGDLAPDDIEFIEWIAEQTVRRGLAMPAVLFIESSKPLTFIGASMMHVTSPIFNAIFSSQTSFDRLARLMEDRENAERLLLAIERRQAEADREAAEARKKRG